MRASILSVILYLLIDATSLPAPITGTPGCVYDFPTGASCDIRVVRTSDSTAKLEGTVLSPSTYAGHFANLPAGFQPIVRRYYPGAVTSTGFSARLVIASERYIETDSGSRDGASKLWTVSSGDWTLAPTSTLCMRCGAGERPTATEGTRSCAECRKSTFSHAGATECTLCAAGKYSAVIAATSIITCAECDVGFYSTAGSEACTACTIGYTTTGGGTSGADQSVCTVCAVKYYSQSGSASGINTGCIECAIGYTITGAGMSGAMCVVEVA
jgi:hypothetical protein